MVILRKVHSIIVKIWVCVNHIFFSVMNFHRFKSSRNIWSQQIMTEQLILITEVRFAFHVILLCMVMSSGNNIKTEKCLGDWVGVGMFSLR